MSSIKIALANVPFPKSRVAALEIVLDAMKSAASGAAAIVCFPECILPGYRFNHEAEAPDQDWLDQAWAQVDSLAAELGIWVILGTERLTPEGLHITARVSNALGQLVGFQDKVQLDPSEEVFFTPASSRRIFQMGDLTFGIVICHEGWRYPETVRWAARNGAHIVFHPHTEIPGSCNTLPSGFADPANTFHEKAALCRAAENSCYFATVNNAFPEGTTTTSAVVDPEGSLLAYQPHGQAGVLFCDIDPSTATGFLAKRCKPQSPETL